MDQLVLKRSTRPYPEKSPQQIHFPPQEGRREKADFNNRTQQFSQGLWLEPKRID
jgi:hypothetical protein